MLGREEVWELERLLVDGLVAIERSKTYQLAW